MKKAFSLIELLIVISIIGILAGFMLTNLSGARTRARDSHAKSELDSVKQALSLYLNVYNHYPSSSSTRLAGCGPTGTSPCPVCTTADFASGGTDGCDNVYMSKISESETGGFFFNYYACSTSDSYRLVYTLENPSDADATESQIRCPAATCSLSYNASDYVVCP